MRPKVGSNPIFIRYTLIFLLFSLVLFLILVPVYRFIVDFTLENELKYINDKLNTGVSAVDSAVVILNNTVFATARDSKFRILLNNPPQGEYNPWDLKLLQERLTGHILAQSLTADAGIIFAGKNIITQQHIFYNTILFSFYDNIFSCENFTYDEWLDELRANRTFAPVWEYKSPDYGTYRAITFSAPWSITNNSEEALLFAAIPLKNLIPLLMDEEMASRGYLRILNPKGAVLAEENFAVSQKYYIVKAQSPVSSLVFEIGVPELLLKEKMKPITDLLVLFSIIIIAITVSTSLIFAYKSSEPLRHFLTKINAIKNLSGDSDDRSEKPGVMRSLKQIFTDTASKILKIDAKLKSSLQTIEQQAQNLKTQIFNSALENGIYSIEDQRQFQSVFPDFPEKFRLADLRYKNPVENSFEETLSVQIRLINMIRSFHEKPGKIYVQGKDGNTVTLLLPVSEEDESWLNTLNRLKNEAGREFDLSLNIALSDIFYKSQDICRAWQQLQFIHVLNGINYTGDVQGTDDIPKENIRFPLNISLLEIIYNSLNNGDDETACSILKECTGMLAGPEDDLIANIIHARFSSMLMQMKLENPILFLDINIPAYNRNALKDLFEIQFPDCFRKICKKINDRTHIDLTVFGQKIIDFIDDHLYDPNLYITMISDHFNISSPTIQKLMKKNSGQTFQTYVQNQRLIKAREMLLTGSFTINEIVAQCGFSLTDSFYKAYKKAYGIPPSRTLKKSVLKNNGNS